MTLLLGLIYHRNITSGSIGRAMTFAHVHRRVHRVAILSKTVGSFPVAITSHTLSRTMLPPAYLYDIPAVL